MFSFVVLSLFLVLGFVSAIPNPAPMYCENMGYSYNETSCIFNGNQSCELWAFFNGKCGSEFIKNLSCVKLGGAMSPGYKCCEGLVGASYLSSVKLINGVCDFAVGSFGTCLACGDGKCDSSYENKCNCEKDCGSNSSARECKTNLDCPTLNCYGESCPVYKCEDGRCVSKNENKCSDDSECMEAVCPNEGYAYTRYAHARCIKGSCKMPENACGIVKNDSNGLKEWVMKIVDKVRNITIIKDCTREGDKVDCIKNIYKEIEIERKNNETRIKSKNISVTTHGEIGTDDDNKTYWKFENKTAEIRIMPDTASDRAIERLKLKVCDSTNNCTIVLKDVGQRNETKIVYEVRAMKEKRFLFWKWKSEVRTQIDAYTGESN